MKLLSSKLANYLVFQAAWSAAVWCVREGLHAAAPLAALLSAALCLATSDDRRGELRVLLLATGIGTLADSLGTRLGILSFPDDPSPVLVAVPAWISAQWLNFATTLRHSLAWLGRKPLLAAALGAVGGPLAYRSSEALGVVSLHEERALAYGALAIEWAVLTPLLLLLSRRVSPARGAAATADSLRGCATRGTS